jgi:hypothetical protein
MDAKQCLPTPFFRPFPSGQIRETSLSVHRIHDTPLDNVREIISLLLSGGYGITEAVQASIYNSEESWEEAEALEMLVTETFKPVLGEEHRDRLTSMASLAAT